MSDSSSSDLPPTRGSQRIPLETRVRLEFDRFQGFVEEYSSNLSLGGMFIRTDEPKPPGTLVEFELALQEDDFTLIQGSGEVVWVREREEGETQPAGMGIRFRELNQRSEDLILQLVQTHLEEGGQPFELYPTEMGGLVSGRPGTRAAAEGAEAPEAPDLDELFSDEPVVVRRGAAAAPEEGGPPPRREEARGRPAAEPGAPIPQTDKEMEAVSELRRFLSGSRRRRQRRRRRLVAAAALLLLAGAAVAVFWHWDRLPIWPAQPEAPRAALDAATPEPAAPPAVAAAPTDREPEAGPDPVPDPEPETPPERAAAEPAPAPERGETELAASPVAAPPTPATAVEEIVWEEAAGEFRLRLRGNGRLDVARTRRYRLDGGNPRELLRIQGIEQPYPQAVVPVTSELVDQIRTGFHQRAGGPELHVVLDLARGGLPDGRIEQRGPDAVLRLARD